MAQGAEDESELYGWEISALFVLFMLISCAWQVFIAIITFLNSFYGGAKTIWLTRLKEEVLDVGVISLVLVFVNPYISSICVPSSHVAQEAELPEPFYPPPSAEGGAARRMLEALSHVARRGLGGSGAVEPCPPGKRHLFPEGSISTAHYLLFFVALVHIVYSLFTFTLTLQRFSKWSSWERGTRLADMDGADVPTSADSFRVPIRQRRLCGPLRACCDCGLRACCACSARSPRPGQEGWCWDGLTSCWRGLLGGVDAPRYMVLRGLFQLRARAYRATAFTNNLHYANVCENAMQVDIENVVAHGWLQALIVAVFTLYTLKLYQILWIGGLSMLLQALLVAKMELALSQVLRIVLVEGRRSAPIYRINTEAKAFQRMAVIEDSVGGSGYPVIPRGGASGSEPESRYCSGRRPSRRLHSQRNPTLELEREGTIAHAAVATAAAAAQASGRRDVNSGRDLGSRRDSGRRESGRRESGRRDSGRRDNSLGAAPSNGGGGPYQPPLQLKPPIRGPGPLAEALVSRVPAPAPAHLLGRRTAEVMSDDVGTTASEAELDAGAGARRGSQEVEWWVAQAAGGTAAEGRRPGAAGPVAEAQDWGYSGVSGSSRTAATYGGGGGNASGTSRGLAERPLAISSEGSRVGKPGVAAGSVSGITRGPAEATASYKKPPPLASRKPNGSAGSSSGGGAGPSVGGRGTGGALGDGGMRARLTKSTSASAPQPPPQLVVGRSSSTAERGHLADFAAQVSARTNPLFDPQQQDGAAPEPNTSHQLGGADGGDGEKRRWGSLGQFLARQTAAGDGADDGTAVDVAVVGPTAANMLALSSQHGESDGAASTKFTNPLFREGAAAEGAAAEGSGSTLTEVAAAAAGAALSAQATTTAPRCVAGSGTAAAAQPPLRTILSLGWRAPPVDGVAAKPPLPGKPAAGKGSVGPHPASAAAAAAGPPPPPPPASEQQQQQAEDAELGEELSTAGSRRRSSFGGGEASVLAFGVQLPAAVADRRRVVKANSLYLNQPHMPILDVPPPPANSGSLPTVLPNLASPRAAAAAASATAAAAAVALHGGPVVWMTAPYTAAVAPAAALTATSSSNSKGAKAAAAAAAAAGTAAAIAIPVRAGEVVATAAEDEAPPPPATSGPPSARTRTPVIGGLPPKPPVAPRARPATTDTASQTVPPLPRTGRHFSGAASLTHTSTTRLGLTPLASLFDPYRADGDSGDGAHDNGGGDDDDVDMELVERKLRGLFWLGRPQLLIWISHVNYLQNSLSLTLCLYYILSFDTGSSILNSDSRLLYLWIPLLVVNLGFMLYMGWVVVPLYTLVTATCTRNPRALQEHIRRHKKAETDDEGGITGFIVRQCTRCFMRSHHAAQQRHAAHGSGSHVALNNLFLANLASQAGVIMAAEAQLTATTLSTTAAVYREFLLIWLAKVRLRNGIGTPPPDGRYQLTADVSEFRSAFNALDGDGSSAVTVDELFTHLHLLGTRATKMELRAMIAQIDNDGDQKVDFGEFLVFMVFCFLDGNGNGCVEVQDVCTAIHRLRLRLQATEISAMVDLADPDGDHKIGLRQFFALYKDLDLPALGPRLADTKPHATTTIAPRPGGRASAPGGTDGGGTASEGGVGFRAAGDRASANGLAEAAAAAAADGISNTGGGTSAAAAPAAGGVNPVPNKYRQLRVRIPELPT